MNNLGKSNSLSLCVSSFQFLFLTLFLYLSFIYFVLLFSLFFLLFFYFSFFPFFLYNFISSLSLFLYVVLSFSLSLYLSIYPSISVSSVFLSLSPYSANGIPSLCLSLPFNSCFLNSFSPSSFYTLSYSFHLEVGILTKLDWKILANIIFSVGVSLTAPLINRMWITEK